MKLFSTASTFASILLVALLLRGWGLNYDLPYVYHPDEPVNVAISGNIFRSGDLNPHFFGYPSLFFYANAAAYVPYYLGGKLLGTFHKRSDVLPLVSLAMGVTKAPIPSVVLLGRVLTVVAGVVSVGLLILTGARLTGSVLVGLFAGLMLAISPTNVQLSRFITPDTFVTMLAIAALFSATSIYRQGKIRQYVVGGLLVGLTASTKYNGGLVVIALVTAHVLRFGWKGFRQRNLYLALICCGIGFIAATPYSLIDFQGFVAGLAFEGRDYSRGHPGMEGDSLQWYLAYMWETAGILYVLAALEIVRGMLWRVKEVILLSTFPIVYFAFICTFAVRNDRTLLPLTPFVFLLAASLIAYLWRRVAGTETGALRYFAAVTLAVVTLAALAQPFATSFANGERLVTTDSRETARQWIAVNLPSGSKIAIESYCPFVETSAYSVHAFTRIIDNDLQWYLDNGFQYLVFSEGMYGRFYHEPERYRNAVSKYEMFFQHLSPLKIFTDGGYEVRIYNIK